MEIIETIYKRIGIRIYSARRVEKDTIRTLLKTATEALTSLNCKTWEFIVIDDAEKLDFAGTMNLLPLLYMGI